MNQIFAPLVETGETFASHEQSDIFSFFRLPQKISHNRT